MRIQYAKEWRLLRPGLAAAAGLALLPLLLPAWVGAAGGQVRDDLSFLYTVALFVGGVLIGIETLGREFHQRTVTMWLTLPAARSELWHSKLAMTGLALAGVLLAHWSALVAGAAFHGIGIRLLHGGALLSGAPLAASGPKLVELIRPLIGLLGGAALGLFWSVRLRQTWAAFWMSLVVPGALMVLLQSLAVLLRLALGGVAFEQPELAVPFGVGFCLASVAAYWVARRQFDRLEDLGPAGEDVQLKLPCFPRRAKGEGATARRARSSPARALWGKEFRLQQLNLALAAGLALIMLLAHALRRVLLELSGTLTARDLEAFDLGWVLWSLLPLTIGLASFAEERRLGVDAWQETLPVSRARRFWIKLAATYGIAFLVGVAAPVAGTQFTRSGPLDGMALLYGLAWLILTTVGIYVSSLARNLVHAVSILVPVAIALGLALAGGTAFTLALVQQPMDLFAAIPAELHFVAVTGSLLLAAALGLAWSNSAPGRGAGAGFKRNALVFAAAWSCGVLVVAGSRVRAWEWLWLEPKPSPPLASMPGVQPELAVGFNRVVALAPDGKLWWYGAAHPTPGSPYSVVAAALPLPQPLEPAQRWLHFDATDYGICAVRSDGTLWRWGPALEPVPDHPDRLRPMPGAVANWNQPVQVGTDADWTAVATSAIGHSVALKRDGSLWGWGINRNGQLGADTAEFVAQPARISAATNWTLIAVGPGNTLAANRAGEIWEWGWAGRPPRSPPNRDRRLPAPTRIVEGVPWARLIVSETECVGLAASGEIWVLRQWRWVAGGADTPIAFPQRQPARDLAPVWGSTWSIDEGGRLSRVPVDLRYPLPKPLAHTPPPPRRVGHRDDWLAVSGKQAVFALTADGGLWTWGLELNRSRAPWLPPSQRPRQIALLREDAP